MTGRGEGADVMAGKFPPGGLFRALAVVGECSEITAVVRDRMLGAAFLEPQVFEEGIQSLAFPG